VSDDHESTLDIDDEAPVSPDAEDLDSPEPFEHDIAPRIEAFRVAADRCAELVRAESARAAAIVYRDEVDPALDRLIELSDRALDAGKPHRDLQQASDAAELRAETLVEHLETLGIEFDDVELPIVEDD
jgi:hypothetical protein